jgi:Domain of unknown function (DUF4276)
MVKEIQIFIEGGSKGQDRFSSQKLREGFSMFFGEIIEKIRNQNIKFRINICGSTDQTFKIFTSANVKMTESFLCLLVDSDKPLKESDTPRIFLEREKKWDLKGISEDQCHLMVQIMESWFLADVETLKTFYGNNFFENAIPKHKDIEKVVKSDIEKSLKKATENTTKAEYHKIKHGAELLAKIDINKVRAKSKHCELLFSTFENKLIS